MRDFNHNLQQLKLCNIKGGIWFDAGCGIGTYTIPLSGLVTKVIAIDKDFLSIQQLRERVSSRNIVLINADFNEYFYSDNIDGVLFAFSLHFQPDINRTLHHIFNQLKSCGMIVIFEYNTNFPVPWIPYPCPEVRLIKSLTTASFKDITLVYRNNKYYIIKGFRID